MFGSIKGNIHFWVDSVKRNNLIQFLQSVDRSVLSTYLSHKFDWFIYNIEHLVDHFIQKSEHLVYN